MIVFCAIANLVLGSGTVEAAFNPTINLVPSGSTPAGGDPDDPTPVTPGQTLSFNTAYTARGTSGGQRVITATLLDINNSVYEPNSISVQGSATPVTQINDGRDGTPAPRDTGNPADPEYWGNPYDNCPKVRSEPGFSDPLFEYSCDPDLGDGVPGQGKSIYWERAQDSNSANPHTVTYKFSFKIREGISGNYKICIRSYIALESLYDDTKARSPQHCYKISRAEVSGTVVSSPEFATGRGLPVPLYVGHTCSGADPTARTVTVNANGTYEFFEAVGNRFCIRAPDTFSYKGTDYVLQKPNLSPKVEPNPLLDQYEYQVADVYCHGNSGQPQNECGSNQENYDRVEDDSFDFEYLPVAQPPVIRKTVLQGEGTPLLPANHPNCIANRDNPGCFASYSMTIDNVRDGNFFDTHIEDQIPLNLMQDGNNVVIDRVVLTNSPDPDGNKPAGWATDTVEADPATCAISTYIAQVFNFGYARENQTRYTCTVFPTNGSVPNQIRVHFDVMPAYSSLTIEWHGYTKDAQNIGVYPSGPRTALVKLMSVLTAGIMPPVPCKGVRT